MDLFTYSYAPNLVTRDSERKGFRQSLVEDARDQEYGSGRHIGRAGGRSRADFISARALSSARACTPNNPISAPARKATRPLMRLFTWPMGQGTRARIPMPGLS